MKKRITILAIMTSIFGFSQETEFKFTKDGFTDYLVIPCEGKTQTDLYKKAIDWVNVTFNNPKEVIKAQIENDYIRIEGVGKNLFCVSDTNCSDGKYQIEISVKDGKYKFDIISVEQFMNEIGWVKFEGLEKTSFYFKETGEPKKNVKKIVEDVPQYFNNLNKSFNDFIVNGSTTKKKNDW